MDRGRASALGRAVPAAGGPQLQSRVSCGFGAHALARANADRLRRSTPSFGPRAAPGASWVERTQVRPPQKSHCSGRRELLAAAPMFAASRRTKAHPRTARHREAAAHGGPAADRGARRRAPRAGGVRALVRRGPSRSEAARRRLSASSALPAAGRGRQAVLAEDHAVPERVGRARRDRPAEDRRGVRRRARRARS